MLAAVFGVLPLLAAGNPATTALAEASAQAPSAPPAFPSRVELITVDAIVLDKDGQSVPGLTKDDFVLKEDGQPREIVGFEAFDLSVSRPQPEAAAPAVVASNEVRAGDAGYAFAIVVDDLGLAPERTPLAQEAIELFLQSSVRDRDLVALGTTSGTAWWSARLPEGREDLLAVLARTHGRHYDEQLAGMEPMSDYEAFCINTDNLGCFASVESVVRRWVANGACLDTGPMGAAGCAGQVRSKAAFLDSRRRDRLHSTLACIRRAIDALAPMRGRKSLLLFSEGFVDDPGSDARSVASRSIESNVAVYFIDVRGLEALPGGIGSAADRGPAPSMLSALASARGSSEGAVALANDTGGFAVRNTNDLAGGAGRVGTESRVFYLLGVHPREGKRPGEWRKLRVEVKRPGLTVRARRGYTLRSEMSAAAPEKADKEKNNEPPRDPVVVRAIDSPDIASGIPLRAIAYVLEPRPKDTVHVLVSAEFDAGAIRPAASGPARLEVTAVAVVRDTGRGFKHDDVVAVSEPKADEPRWRAFTREFELPPGVAQIRVVVRDPASGALGSVVQRIEVPSAAEFRISTPILTDRMAPATLRDPLPQPALSAHRSFPSGGGLYCQYEVFGATRPTGAVPRVEASFALRRGNGNTVREVPPTPIAIAADGRLVRTIGTSLGELEGGDYEIILDVRDEVSGRRVVRHEPFTLASREER